MKLIIEINLDRCPGCNPDAHVVKTLYHLAESIEYGSMQLDDLEHVAWPIVDNDERHIGSMCLAD